MSIPYIKKVNNQSILMVNDQPFVMLSGEVHNSSSSTTEYMEWIWKKLKMMNLNSVIMPITWELIEPEEGKFEFDLVDGLIKQAREHQMKIGFLWFGTWKNARCTYAPAWVKRDKKRFCRTEVEKGQNLAYLKNFYNLPYTSLSAFGKETMKADAKAFQTLMKHIKKIDSNENTVIMIQVENEVGILGTARENSDLADELFQKNVPDGLVEFMESCLDTLEDDIRDEFMNGKKKGNWSEVFGKTAEEIFSAFYTAKYVNYVATAGKEEYPLPMAVNAWLTQGKKPGQYPSGGPVARVMEVWKYAAPNIDIFAPDIYVPAFCDVCNEYTKMNNPLFIPEVASHAYAGSREVYVIGAHHAMCYSPFGIEDMGEQMDVNIGELIGMDVSDPALKMPQNLEEYARINDILSQMMPIITSKYGTSDLQAVIKKKDDTYMKFGKYGFNVVFDSPLTKKIDGVCLVAKLDENEFLLLACGCMIFPMSLDKSLPFIDYLSVEEGKFKDGKWHMIRKLNGDETHFLNINDVMLLKIKLDAYN